MNEPTIFNINQYAVYPSDVAAIRQSGRLEWQVEINFSMNNTNFWEQIYFHPKKKENEKVNWKVEGF